MSLSIYSAQSAEANRLRKGDFEIYYDEENDQIVFKTGNEKVFFNVVYNKEEVDQLISQGVDPTSFENWIFNTHAIYSFATGGTIDVSSIATLLTYLQRDMQALKTLTDKMLNTDSLIKFDLSVKPETNKIYDALSLYSFLLNLINKNDIVSFDPEVQPLTNKIYDAQSLYQYLIRALYINDLIKWNDDERPQNDLHIYDAQSLYDKITSIQECTCDPEVMSFIKDFAKISYIQQSSDKLTLPKFYMASDIHAYGLFQAGNYPMMTRFSKRPDIPLTEDEEQTINYEIDEVNDYDPFDPTKPVYGTYTLPCCITLNGTLNGIHTDDILTKDDIDDLGGSHFKKIDGAPSFNMLDSNISIERIYNTEINDRLVFTVDSRVVDYLKTLKEKMNVIEVKLVKYKLYDDQNNLLKSFYIQADNTKWYCPTISKNSNGLHYISYNGEVDIESNPFIVAAFSAEDTMKDLYTSGNLILNYSLTPTHLQSNEDVVKCDIIDSRNSLKLIETQQLYLYEPSMISEKTIDDIDYWYEVYNINQHILDGQVFTFNDLYTGYLFELEWNESDNRWKGNNNMQILRPVSGGGVTSDIPSHFTLYICKTEAHRICLEGIINTNNNWIQELYHKGRIKFFLVFEDGTERDITNKFIWTYCSLIKRNDKEYYYAYYTASKLIKEPDLDYSDSTKQYFIARITINSQSITDLKYSIYHYNLSDVGGKGVSNIVDQLRIVMGSEIPNSTGNTKDIELYIRKDFALDSLHFTENVFDYINTRKYYKITPLPESCSTLYTDYNIYSSKIITADNITTMAADLNDVDLNDVQNFSYDLEAMIQAVSAKLNAFIEALKEQQEKTAAINAAIGGFVLAGAGLSLIGNVLGNIGELNFLGEAATTIRGNNTYMRIVSEEGEIELHDFLLPVPYETINSDVDWSEFSYVTSDGSTKPQGLNIPDLMTVSDTKTSSGEIIYTEERLKEYEEYTSSLTGNVKLIGRIQKDICSYINQLHKRLVPIEHIYASSFPLKLVNNRSITKGTNMNQLF